MSRHAGASHIDRAACGARDFDAALEAHLEGGHTGWRGELADYDDAGVPSGAGSP
jgi:hypothetical protein